MSAQLSAFWGSLPSLCRPQDVDTCASTLPGSAAASARLGKQTRTKNPGFNSRAMEDQSSPSPSPSPMRRKHRKHRHGLAPNDSRPRVLHRVWYELKLHMSDDMRESWPYCGGEWWAENECTRLVQQEVKKQFHESTASSLVFEECDDLEMVIVVAQCTCVPSMLQLSIPSDPVLNITATLRTVDATIEHPE